jgi:uncharacterized lipoprotein YddW (UPF0748 family)
VNRRLVFGLVFVLVAVAVPTGIAGFWPGLVGMRSAVPGSPTCDGRPLVAQRQLRGMWLTTIRNADWPSRPGLPVEKAKAEYLSWLDLAQQRRLNAVFVHVRPSGDALWPSKYVPWSKWLTGRDGGDPGWDPMAWMIAETHARNLEFHAWFNPYRATVGGPTDIPNLAPNHPLRTHRDWLVAYPADPKKARFYYDPGIPDARRFVEDSILEAVQRYDIDGVHFDDFFYPYPENGDFPDGASYARHGKGVDKGQWRRDNVDTFVREMHERIKALKPWVRFGISPFGIWRNKKTDPAGSATSGLQSYDAIYADSRKWVREKWLDYIVPQLYWHIGFSVADYAKLLPWWAKTVEGTGVHLYIGQADYRVGESGAWSNPAQLDRQLALNARYKVNGSVHFSARQVRANRLGSVSRYGAAHYAAPALVPIAARLKAPPPGAPALTVAERKGRSAVMLEWRPSAGPPTIGYAVYRADGSDGNATLLVTLRATADDVQRWTDATAVAGRRYTYCVAAVDRNANQSGASAPGTVT